MKSKKNLILGLLAFVFAVGSAFASVLATVRADLRVKFLGEASATCRDTGISCNDVGTDPCLISFPYDSDGSGPNAPVIASFQAKRELTNCTVALTHTGATPQAATWNTPGTEIIEQVIE